MTELTPHQLIARQCDRIKRMLLAKNKGYGNSALDPIRIFSKLSVGDSLAVRIDDKLSRIQRGEIMAVQGEDYCDTVSDLIGYLILLLIDMENGKTRNIT